MPRALVAAVLFLLSCPALAEVRGMVYEVTNPDAPRAEWRRQPLANAYVTMVWSIVIPAPAHATESCRHAEIARTDAMGEYIMEGPSFVAAGLARPMFLVYSPGRDAINFPYPGTLQTPADITTARSTVPPEQRLNRLMLFDAPGCAGYDRKLHDPRGLLKPYYDSLYEEAKSLNVETQAGRNILRSLEAKTKPAPAYGAPLRIEAAPVDLNQLQQKSTPRGD